MDPRLEPLPARTPGWLREGAPDGDVVVSSRVRLARNLARTRFPHLLPEDEAEVLCARVREHVRDWIGEAVALDPRELEEVERDLLVERNLASRDLLEAPRPTLLAFGEEETRGILVNEEDHFRIQAIAPGLQFPAVQRAARSLSLQVGRVFPFATHERYGFLTACPTNLGTGLRASVLLHLPALGRARQPLEKVIKTAQRSQLAVRGFHGEGSGSMGDFYQISNQSTLGTTQAEQVERVRGFTARVVEFEREVRHQLFEGEEHRRLLEEHVARALETLAGAEALATQSALECLGILRLATLGGLLPEGAPDLDPHRLLELSFRLQPGHLQLQVGRSLGPEERDRERARLVREALGIPSAG